MMPHFRPAIAALFLLASAAPAADYTRDVKPLFARYCVSCHGPGQQRAGLRLDTAAAVLQGGNSGPAVVPGRADASRLLQALAGSGGVTRMPPRGRRPTTDEVARLQAWIDAGAVAPTHEPAPSESPKSKHW